MPDNNTIESRSLKGPGRILGALGMTARAIKDGYFWKVLVLTAVVNIALFMAFFFYLLQFITPDNVGNLWGIEKIILWMGPWFVAFITLLLLPLSFPLVTLLFLDAIVGEVEQKYYPERVSRPVALAKSLESASGLMIIALFINILLLPVYILLPGISLLLYFAVNGYIMGREYYDMVALRHFDSVEASIRRKSSRFTFWMAGALMTFTFMIPGINLLAPVLATIFMVHLFHRPK